ncbi:tRNA uridine-5-carboxymethylaminomethyl(34) synthesis GTPase MnmE, partial [Desulfobacterales bacterium HSG2]|nr:tRNA uridine-5-carboxymethylaminomethyl(34) synthesis GTPase MnmE [Desulfobacterales bacterium HSG2]
MNNRQSMDHSTIAAIATPTGSGGVGIIKISGQDAVSIAASLFRPSGRDAVFSEKGVSAQSHHLYHGHITDPENGQVLDEVLLTVMQAPRSYTREDVVEIQAHSGYVVLRSILNLVL